MFREFFCAQRRLRTAWAWLGLLIFVAHHLFNAHLARSLNDWYEKFYNALGEHSSGDDDAAAGREAVYDSLLEFCAIVAPAVVVHPVAGYLRNRWVFSWRLALVNAYLAKWDASTPPIEGASQRIHEDTQRFASGLQTCCSTVLNSILTLAVFCPPLYAVDPSLMFIAVSTALGGLFVSIGVGHRLVGLEVANQKTEAELRKQLVLLEAEPVKNDAGSAAPTFVDVLAALNKNYQALYCNFAALSTWLSAFDQSAVVLPYLLVAPRLFAADLSNRLTLGQLVKVTNAFSKVFNALNVVSENFLALNEWRSTLRRLREFELSMSAERRLVAVALSDTKVAT
jgi:ABC-type long-subunit fatty acid transport system fused permease/ATPase subunit